MFAVSVAGECESWEFLDDVLLVCFLEQCHIGLGGGGKVFQDVKFWERQALDIELEYRDDPDFRYRMPSLRRALVVGFVEEAFSGLKTLVSRA